jgi:cytoskeletal protein CcmA (bactofilin family)
MFSKSSDATPNAPYAGSNLSNRTSVLAHDLVITGEISSTGTVEVLGRVDGNISSRGLIVGSEGRVSGVVQAETVEVRGTLDGAVASHSFTLRAAARVKADVAYAVLVIESGAEIEGNFTRGEGA